jgi:uroporphyrinogen-III synthase
VLPHLNPKILGSHTGNGEALAHYILEHYQTLSQSPQPPQPKRTTASIPRSDNKDDEYGDDNGDDVNHGDSNNKPKGELSPLLFLVGDQRRDIIPKTLMSPSLPREQRVQVDELVVYETGVMASFAEDLDRAIRTCQGQATSATSRPSDEESSEPLQLDGLDSRSRVSNVIVVVIFSPSGCRDTLQRLGLLDEKSGKAKAKYLSRPSPDHRDVSSESKTTTNQQADGNVSPPPPPKTTTENQRFIIATIGPTTRDYMRKQFNFEADICAETPSPEGVGKGIMKYLEQQGMLQE